jgi:hypothetical protein
VGQHHDAEPHAQQQQREVERVYVSHARNPTTALERSVG